MSNWKFTNKTKNTYLECNDLSFLMSQLKNRLGLKIPVTGELLLYGHFDGIVQDCEGNNFDIEIIEISD
ncbi:hypothetical protein D3C81_09510 [compost metagenome]